MSIECYLVIVKKRGKEARALRITSNRPSLQKDEAVIRLSIDVPEDIFDAPIITVPVERRQVAVAIEVDEL